MKKKNDIPNVPNRQNWLPVAVPEVDDGISGRQLFRHNIKKQKKNLISGFTLSPESKTISIFNVLIKTGYLSIRQ